MCSSRKRRHPCVGFCANVTGNLKAPLHILNMHCLYFSVLCSAFQALHAALKDQYPEIVEPFRFPHKSMFNTFSNYTKERRRQGFDDFLKLLVSLDPLPTEVARFLELDDHVWPHAATLPQQNQENASGAGNGAAGNRKPTTAGASGSTSPTASSFSAAGANSSASASSASLSASSADGQTRSGEVKTPLTGKDVLKTMKTTFIATTVLYTVSIVLGIFDVKKSSAGELPCYVFIIFNRICTNPI